MIKSYISIAGFIFLFGFFAHADVYGVLMVVKGDVQIISKLKNMTKAKVGQKVFPGDTIETKEEARAKVVMLDKNVINISPNSKFEFQKYEYDPDQNKKGALLNVIYGKIRMTVNQKYDDEKNKFQVKTKTSVAGVRGTDFLVSFNRTTEASKVVTFQGQVAVGQSLDANGNIMNPVFVPPGQFTVANPSTAPIDPAGVPMQELSTMNQQTVADSVSHENATIENRTPSSSGGSNQHASSVLGEMGESISAPVAEAPVQNVPGVPSGTTQNPCPNGQCTPLQIDPSLLTGITRVIIDLK